MSTQHLTPEQVALRDQIRAEYPYLIERGTAKAKMSGIALGAKNIKLMLGHAWPGTKFRVVSDRSTGGSSIDVSWDTYDDAPSSLAVKKLIWEKFASTRVDGSTDSTDYDRDPWRQAFRSLFGSASHVFPMPQAVSPQQRAERQAMLMEKQTPQAKTARRGPRL